MSKKATPKITQHAKQRLLERIHTKGDAAQRLVNKAYKHGLSHRDVTGELRIYMSNAYLAHDIKFFNPKIYKNAIYIFDANKLVTVYILPEELQDVSKYVSEEKYEQLIIKWNL